MAARASSCPGCLGWAGGGVVPACVPLLPLLQFQRRFPLSQPQRRLRGLSTAGSALITSHHVGAPYPPPPWCRSSDYDACLAGELAPAGTKVVLLRELFAPFPACAEVDWEAAVATGCKPDSLLAGASACPSSPGCVEMMAGATVPGWKEGVH